MEENFKKQEETQLDIVIVCPYQNSLEEQSFDDDFDAHWNIPYYSVHEKGTESDDYYILDTIGFNFIEKINIDDYVQKYFECTTPSVSAELESQIISNYLFFKDIKEKEELKDEEAQTASQQEIDSVNLKMSPQEQEEVIKRRYDSYLEKMNNKFRGKFIIKETRQWKVFMKIGNLRINYRYCEYYPELWIECKKAAFHDSTSKNTRSFQFAISENDKSDYYESDIITAIYRFQHQRDYPLMFCDSKIIESEEEFKNLLQEEYEKFFNNAEAMKVKMFNI